MSWRAVSNISGHPRLAAGLAGLGWGAAPHPAPAACASGAARRAANAPTPTTFAGRRRAITAASASSQAANRGSRSARGSLSGGDVPTALVHEGERAVVPHEGAPEEAFRGSETLPRPAPEAGAAHLAPSHPEAHHRPLGVLAAGSFDRRLDPEPAPHHRGVAEGDPVLGHPERPRVHADEEDLPRPAPVAFEVETVRRPCVVEGRVDMGHGRREPEGPGPFPEPFRDRDEVGHCPYSTPFSATPPGAAARLRRGVERRGRYSTGIPNSAP